jgi:hypothetical protein
MNHDVITILEKEIECREATLNEALIIDAEIRNSANMLSACLWLAKAGSTWKQLKDDAGVAFESFEAYARSHNIGLSHANRLIAAMNVQKSINASKDARIPETHLRSLATIPEEARKAIWDEANRLAEEAGKERTAKMVEDAIKEYKAELNRKNMAIESTIERAKNAEKQASDIAKQKEEWRLQSLAERDAKRALEAEVSGLRNQKPIIQYVDDSDKVREEFKARIEKLQRDLKEAQEGKITAIRETRDKIHSGYDSVINTKQQQESAINARLIVLKKELEEFEVLIGGKTQHLKAREKFNDHLEQCAVAMCILSEPTINDDEDGIAAWEALLKKAEVMLVSMANMIADRQIANL